MSMQIRKTLGAISAALVFAFVAAAVLTTTPFAQAQTFNSLYSFSGDPDGATAFAGVIAKHGTLYGTTESGGSSNVGTIYECKVSGSTCSETVLHSFSGSDGEEPFGSLVMDSAGNFYGATIAGGSSSAGTVYMYSSSGLTTLYNFTGGSDGSGPFSGLLLVKGNLIGTTVGGGASSAGTVFSVNIKNKTEKVLYSFTGQNGDGAEPLYGNLAMDKEGNIYGTTVGGGASGDGTVWELSKKGKESVLYSFTGGADGSGVFEQSLATDDKGNLYGTTENGGTNSAGVAFKVNIKKKSETVLWSFGGSGDASVPSSGITRDSKGNLYGTSQIGGANNAGTVWKLHGKKEAVLHSFDGTDGQSPFTSPVLDEKGTLYGTTYAGGAHSAGTIYSLKP